MTSSTKYLGVLSNLVSPFVFHADIIVNFHVDIINDLNAGSGEGRVGIRKGMDFLSIQLTNNYCNLAAMYLNA